MNDMNTENSLIVRRALVSVSDKTGIVQLAEVLANQNVEILSTGGTAKHLRERDFDIIDVSHYTGFPEIMGGRVKTLHPKVHGGILGRTDQDSQEMDAHEINPIDLVVVNLYPFQSFIANNSDDLAGAIENIDIGGPCMIRAAAKNFESTCVVVDPADYDRIAEEIGLSGGISKRTRFRLAAKAFSKVANYDSSISQYLAGMQEENDKFPHYLNLSLVKKSTMRYGENPHQSAAFFGFQGEPQRNFLDSKMLQGKELSYNNLADADGAIECVREFDEPTCVIVKHGTPCGVASAVSVKQAYERAFKTDPTSAFGGIIAFNREIDSDTAAAIIDQQFVEVVAATKVSQEAAEVFSQKTNVRVLEFQLDPPKTKESAVKSISGGLLIQDRDTAIKPKSTWDVVTDRRPNDRELEDLEFAWKVVKHVKSNAIVFALNKMTTGIGSGQSSRVDSATIGVHKARNSGLDSPEQVMASDAFMPFPDTLEVAQEFGVSAVVQPGGSVSDAKVIDYANGYNIAMTFTGMRHFRH